MRSFASLLAVSTVFVLLVASLAVAMPPVPADPASSPQVGLVEPPARYHPATLSPEEATRVVEFDVATGVERVLDAAPLAVLSPAFLEPVGATAPVAAPSGVLVTPGERGTPGDVATALRDPADVLAGLLGESSANVIGADDRTRVTPTTTYPYTAVTKLYVTTATGGKGICSGSVINGYHVLTAGHCIHGGQNSNWFTDVRVLPAMDDGWTGGDYEQRPLYISELGEARVSVMRSYTGWTQNGDRNYDWALLTLDRNVGVVTGTFGRTTAAASNAMYTGTIETAGYPGDRDSGINMYRHSASNSGCTTSEFIHNHRLDTAGGQSGSAVWRSGPYVMSIHVAGFAQTNQDCSAQAVRLNQDKYDRITTWITEDNNLGRTPTNRPELVEYVGETGTLSSPAQPRSSFSPTVIRPGAPWNFNMDVRNVGMATAGGWWLDIHASTDTNIQASDPLLFSFRSPSLGPMSWLIATANSYPFPTIPDGVYNIGWIIDADNEIAEMYGEGVANLGYERQGTLRVDGTKPSASIVAPAVGTLLGYSVTYSASDAGSGLTGNALIQQNLNGGGFSTVCTRAVSGPSASGTCSVNPSSVGNYCYRLVVSDIAGNTQTSATSCTLRV